MTLGCRVHGIAGGAWESGKAEQHSSQMRDQFFAATSVPNKSRSGLFPSIVVRLFCLARLCLLVAFQR